VPRGVTEAGSVVPGNCGTHRQSNDLGDAVSADFEDVANLSLAARGDDPYLGTIQRERCCCVRFVPTEQIEINLRVIEDVINRKILA
jgi:hypothetical protein